MHFATSLVLLAISSCVVSPVAARAGKRACRARKQSHSSAIATSDTSSTSPPGVTVAAFAASAARMMKTTSAAASESTPLVSIGLSIGGGLFGKSDSSCGKSGAEDDSSETAGPNGADSWLACGLSLTDRNSGWTPPFITIDQIKTISLDYALTQSNTPYAACKPFVHLFDKYGASTGVPPIMLAAFAMQESSCRPGLAGDNGGAHGLMQITQDKCGGAPNGDCKDPEYNIKTAAEYFASTLKSNDGDLLRSLGTYNGWYPGLTYNKANAIFSQCCQCVNNLDYLHQMLNWWVLGKDGSSKGSFRNLKC